MTKPRLTLVPKKEPTPKERVRTRVKSVPRPSGMLQCPECGSRSVMTVRNGVRVKDGKRLERGTLISNDDCADCHARTGRKVRMIPGGQGPKPV